MHPADNNQGNDRPFLYIYSYPPPAVPVSPSPLTGVLKDVGTRPLPPEVAGKVTQWLCSGIRPLTAFQPGSDLTLQVTIGNWQGGNSESIAYVDVWWSPPFSGPIKPSKDNYIGFAPVNVAAHGGIGQSPPLTKTIPPTAGDHICLLARVQHPLDMPTQTLADPVNDRHWGQHNLISINVANPKPVIFLATNPKDEPAEYEIRVQPVQPELLPNFVFDKPIRPAQASARFLLVSDAQGREFTGEGTLTSVVALEPQEQREMRLSVELAEPLQQGTFAGLEIVQYDVGQPTGGIGIALLAP